MSTIPGIDFDQYRIQAKELLKSAKAADTDALQRIRCHHAETETLIKSGSIQLADTQLVIAREMGLESWAKLKQYLLFSNAVATLDSGNIERLREILERNPSVLRYRCNRGEWYEFGYFKGAALLHHIAGNPIRCPIPSNIIAITRLLLKHGADPNIRTDEGNMTIGLLLTSKQASESGCALPLVDILIAAGAEHEMDDPQLLTMPLLNAAPATASELVKRGVKMDIRHAAGLGRIDSLEALLKSEDNKPLIEEALAFAAIRGQEETARILLRHGARGDILVSPEGMTPRTALHEAANRGYESILKLMIDNGADPKIIEPCWGGTPAGWAEHGGYAGLADYLIQFSNDSER